MEQLVEWLQQTLHDFSMISIFDIVDIAIIAFIIYRVILLVRTTSSGQVAKGVILLFVALGLSTFFHLYTVNFLLSRALEYGAVALVVLFQPELRKLLEQVGSSRIGKMFSTKQSVADELDDAITQTVLAYEALSESKTGALMVFERKNLLDDTLRTGTELDARVNAELLKNIFWNKAPLHDGAVIIRDGRIVGAGCMLPMSGSVNLSKDLGMRHRAGIGVSEQTDAIAAIVSEETGSISVAVGGMLKRHLAPETLERLLRNELMPEKKEDENSPFNKLSALIHSRKEGKGNEGDNKV